MPNFFITVPATDTTGLGENRRPSTFANAAAAEFGVNFARTPDVSYAYFEVAPGPLQALSNANIAPVANPDSVSTPFGNSVTFDPRANDTDDNGDPLTITAVTLLTGLGTASFTATSLTVIPSGGYEGAITGEYTITDGQGGVTTGTWTVTVLAYVPALSSYEQTVVARAELKGYWNRIEDGIAPDLSGNGRHGDLVGSVTQSTDGPQGKSLNFSAVTDNLITPALGLTGAGARTVIVYLKAAAAAQTANFPAFVALGDQTDTGAGVKFNFVARGPDGHIPQVAVGTTGFSRGTTPLLNDVWRQVVCTVQASGSTSLIKFYIDGGSDPVSIFSDITLNMTTGLSAILGKNLIGRLAEIQVYERELTAQEIADDYAAAVPAPVAPTLAFGSLTAVGAGAVPIDEADGVYGELTVSGGMIFPNTSPITLGEIVVGAKTYNILANRRDAASLAELTTAINEVPLDGSVECVLRAGNYRGETGTYQFPVRSFTAEQRVICEGYAQGDFAANGTWTALMPAIKMDGCNWISFFGFDGYQEGASSAEYFSANESFNCGIYDFKAASKSLVELATDGTDQNDNSLATGFRTGLTNGVRLSNALGIHVKRGYFEDFFTWLIVVNGGNSSGTNGRDAEIAWNELNRYGQNLTTSNSRNTTGTRPYLIYSNIGTGGSFQVGDPVSSTNSAAIHSSTGMSGNPTGNRSNNTVWFAGNIFALGSWRLRLYEGLYGVTPANSATGAKFNDPNPHTDSYSGNGTYTYEDPFLFANINQGKSQNGMIAGAFRGAQFFNGWLHDVNHGGGTQWYLDAWQGGVAIDNLTQQITRPASSEFEASRNNYADTGLSLRGHNLGVVNRQTWIDMFEGRAGSFEDLTVEDLRTAFTPIPGTLAAQRHIGPINNPNFNRETGEVTVPHMPYATAAPAALRPGAKFSGSNYLSVGISNPNADDQALWTYAIQFWHNGTSGTFTDNNSKICYVKILSSGTIDLVIKEADDVTICFDGVLGLRAKTHRINTVVISVNQRTGYQAVVVNGELDPVTETQGFGQNTVPNWTRHTARIGADSLTSNYFEGALFVLGLRFGKAFELTDQTVFETMFDTSGQLRPSGTNGDAFDGTPWQAWFEGDGAAFGPATHQGGSLTSFAEGIVPDVFKLSDFDLVNTSVATSLAIRVHALPADTGTSAITDIEYRRNEGTWTSLGGTTTGTYTPVGLTGLTADRDNKVQLRAVSAAGAGSESDSRIRRTLAGAGVSVPTATLSGVSGDVQTVLTFNQPMTLGYGEIQIRRTSDNVPVERFNVSYDHLHWGAGSFDFDGTVMTMSPRTPRLASAHYLHIPRGAFLDASFNSYPGN